MFEHERRRNGIREAPMVITSLRWMWQCTGKGTHNLILFTDLPLSFSFWVLKTTETCFYFPSLTSIFLSHWVMKMVIWNSSKQILIPETHTIWMMETENWVISLKTHPIQTSSYFSFYICHLKQILILSRILYFNNVSQFS